MAFQQLYYTSCESGLAGYGGYQFNAVTPGTSPVVMREVEDRTVYEPPRWLLADPCLDEPEAYPVALSYGRSEATDAAIVAQVMFAGTDYSGRPGNYFAHALVTSTPGPDFGPLLPAELWGSELWRSIPIESNELPELPGPLPRGVIDRPGVQAFLDARGTETVLPELLTAVCRAMADDRPVLLASHDANENIWWIAAVSYLLGEHLAPRMTFTTYSHRPGYSRHHLIGILSDAAPPDADSGFQLFDLGTGKTPGGGIHPLAALLAGTGVMATEALWRQATVFASGAEEGPDDWVGPVAAATGLLGGRLSASETDAVARWLPEAADRMPSQHADVVLGVALAQPDATLTDEQLLSLLDQARRLPSPAQAERLEHLLAKRAVTHIARGEPAEPVRFATEAAQTVQAQASGLLRTATPATALAALEWSAASGTLPPDAELEQYGLTGLGLDTPEPELTQILRAFPAVLHGLLARLANEPGELAQRVLAGPAGALISGDDLVQYPGLAEERLLVSVDQGHTEPLQAFDQIVDIRARAQRLPYVDGTLLERLWPAGCPPRQITELLGIITEPPPPDVRGWFVTEIKAAAEQGTKSGGWLRLAQALNGHQILSMLPGNLAQIAQNTAQAAPKLRQARSAVRNGDVSVFAGLYAEYATTDDSTRLVLNRELVAMLAEAEPLSSALRDCPGDVMAAFCRRVRNRLATQVDTRLAVRVFAAFIDPDLQAQPQLTDQLAAAFEPVRGWHRRDLNVLAQILERRPGVAEQFQAWRDSHCGGLTRKLFGAPRGAAKRR